MLSEQTVILSVFTEDVNVSGYLLGSEMLC